MNRTSALVALARRICSNYVESHIESHVSFGGLAGFGEEVSQVEQRRNDLRAAQIVKPRAIAAQAAPSGYI